MKLNVDDLVEQGLVKKKTYTEGKYKGLSVLKYARKVFYDNLWHLDERLLECRGTVVDEEDNVIVLPFKKVFNYKENGCGEKLPPDKFVQVIRKVNSFMAAATLTDDYGLIISTTGSLDSTFADIARKWVEQGNYNNFPKGCTLLFEICDEKDPHIVEETFGAYLIGMRWLESGHLVSEDALDALAKEFNYSRPFHCKLTMEGSEEVVRKGKHEGIMVRDEYTGIPLFKWKSNHYLSKKLIMRLGKSKIDMMFDNPYMFKQRIKDEEFFEFIDYMVENIDKEVWRGYSDQQRRDFIERYYAGD